MKRKAKSCKGIGRARGFKGCGKQSKRRKYGLCPSCLIEWGQSTEEGRGWYASQFLKQVDKIKKKRKREEDRQKREELKSISRLIREARVPFQKWIRMRDANDLCISCGGNSEIWDAGHYLKAELYTGLIFNEINVNKQCRKCNTFLGGNETGYRRGLVKKYGEKKVKALEESANHLRSYKYSREEIKDIKKRYQNKIKQMK